MKTKNQSVLAATALGLLALMAVMMYLNATASVASPARDAVITVCLDGSCDYDTIQSAVNAAKTGDTIKVAAGVYSGVHSCPAPVGYPEGTVVTQVVHIAKSITVEGGYTVTNWTTPDREANPTTVDAEGQGRGMFIAQPPAAPVIDPTVAGFCITGGDARGLRGHSGSPDTDAGGGVYVFSTTATISGTEVFSNAAEWGAGLYLYRSGASLVRSAVLSHTAPRVFKGGGLYLYESPALLGSNTVLANHADRGGGLYLHRSSATLTNNRVLSNTAEDYGGGMRLERSATTLIGNTVRGNTAQFGGGLYLSYSDAQLSANELSKNGAEQHGGGLYLFRSDPRLMSNLILSNAAGMHGGGLHLYLRSDPVLTNTVIADNRADISGSGLYIWNSVPRLLHTTVARNAGGDGSGLYVRNDLQPVWTVSLTNTILVSHSVGISVSAGSVITVNGILWDSGTPITTSQSGLTTLVSVRNQVVGEPVFAPDGYHLLPQSAAVDRGVAAGVHVDIDGEPRPSGLGYDLGADEMSSPFFAAFTHSGPDWVGHETVFTNTSIVSGPVSYLWDFGDGATSTDVNPRNAYASPGRYTVVLTAFNDDRQSVATRSVIIYAASFTSSSPDWLGQDSVFTNTTAAGSQAEYLWDLGDGVTSTQEHLTHTYAAPGSYNVVLRAANQAGSGVVTGMMIVYGPPRVDFVASPTFGFRPLSVEFTPIVTTTPPGDPSLAYLWRFGDGTTGTLPSPTHRYGATGVYTVSLQVSNPLTSVEEIKPELLVVREARFIYLPLVVRDGRR